MSDDEPVTTDDSPSPTSKVARMIDKYDLPGFGEELEARWVGDGYERQSLRELADVFNRRVLEAALRDSRLRDRAGEIDRLYRKLTDEETTSGTRQQIRNELTREGVDVETLQEDFVSHQAIHTYLRKYRDVERESEETDRIATTQEAIERLQGRLQAVVERNLETLISTDRLALGSFDVIVTVSIVCNDCQSQYSVFDLLDRGHCDCEHS